MPALAVAVDHLSGALTICERRGPMAKPFKGVVNVDVTESVQPFVDLANEARIAFARD
jgi:hypothetical protein